MERKSDSLFVGMFLAIVVFSSPIAFAQETQIPIPAVLPDSFFYNFKLAIETLQEIITLQEDRRAELLLKHAEERDIEARALEVLGRNIPIERLKEIQADKIMKAEIIILRLEGVQRTIDDREELIAERDFISQATTEVERLRLQEQQRMFEDRAPQFIERDLSKPDIIEGQMLQRSTLPIEILPVEDIKDTDEPSLILQKLRDRLVNAFTTSQITELRAEFQELRLETDPERKRFLADQLDKEVNNPIVSITCFGTVDTFSLSVAPNPIDELQEQCPILRPIPDDQLQKLADGFGS